jgi:hypothetical protein
MDQGVESGAAGQYHQNGRAELPLGGAAAPPYPWAALPSCARLNHYAIAARELAFHPERIGVRN